MQKSQPPAERRPGGRFFFSPDERRLRAGWRLALQLLLFILGLFVFALPFSVLLLIPPDWLRPFTGDLTGNRDLLISAPAQLLATYTSVLVARRFFDHRPISSLGIRLERHTLQDLLSGFFIAGPMIGSIFLLEWSLGWLQVNSFAWQTQSLPAIALQALSILFALILAAFAEELQFRGYWLVNLTEGINLPWAAFLSSIVFSLFHLANPGISPAALIGLLLAGLFFVLSVRRTGSLWLATGVHFGWNFFLGPVFGFQISGLNAFQLIGHTVEGPVIFTGGAFGPEAGLFLLPALGIGLLLIGFYTRGRKPGTLSI